MRLTTEAVQSAALALESVDDIKGGDGLALGMLGVGDSVANNTLEEGLENTTGLLIDHWQLLVIVLKRCKGNGLTSRDTFDTATTSETTDGRLGDALDVVTKNLAVTLRAAFAEALATFSA
jgi:hypothetical protein